MTESRMRVLIVDDDPDFLRTAQRAFSSEFDVLTAGGPNEALEVLAHHEVDMVVSDLEMPGLNGIDLLKLVARSHPNVLRVLLSGHALTPPHSAEAINEAEVIRYLSKTQRFDQLVAGLRALRPRLHSGPRETQPLKSADHVINTGKLRAALARTSWADAAELLNE